MKDRHLDTSEYCSNCSARVDPDGDYCASCGASLMGPGATYLIQPRSTHLRHSVAAMPSPAKSPVFRRWPRAVTVFTIGTSIVWSIGVSLAKGNPAFGLAGLLLAALGAGLLYLASVEEANLRREIAVWLSVFAYVGTMVGCLCAITGTDNGTGVPGLLFGTGVIILFAALPLGMVALPYTLSRFATEAHEDPVDDEQSRAVVRRGLELGAALGATILVVFGLLMVTFGDHPTWTDGARVAAAIAVVLVATAFMAMGATLHVPGSPERLGLALLWTGAVGLGLFGLLDSNTATSLSGTPAGYGTDLSGFGYWFLPGAVLGLMAALAGTHWTGHRHGKKPTRLTPVAPMT